MLAMSLSHSNTFIGAVVDDCQGSSLRRLRPSIERTRCPEIGAVSAIGGRLRARKPPAWCIRSAYWRWGVLSNATGAPCAVGPGEPLTGAEVCSAKAVSHLETAADAWFVGSVGRAVSLLAHKANHPSNNTDAFFARQPSKSWPGPHLHLL